MLNQEMKVISGDNHELSLAWQLVEYTSSNVFLTGNAGTGKTSFLRLLREKSCKRMVVLAPTGIAAINAQGVTIHSFFQLSPGLYLPGVEVNGDRGRFFRFSKEKLRLIRSIDLLVIDEISMVRADLLDAIDASMRRIRNPWKPFGGVQLLIIGDLSQLAPVVKDSEWELMSKEYATPYFFSSHALTSAGYQMVELKKNYRQSDERFIGLLDCVRNGRADRNVIDALNTRCIPGFNPPDSEKYIRLTTHNDRARMINISRMESLPGQYNSYKAKVKGDFSEASFPAASDLQLKPGAQVMFIKNNTQRGYYNGLIGHVTVCGDTFVDVLPDGFDKPIKVEAEIWQNNRYVLDDETGQVREEVIGEFAQIPLRPAWAITIHKSQGLTFDKAIIDTANAFAHGQTYVALSRCRSLEGIVLDSPVTESSFICDSGIVDFTEHKRNLVVNDHELGRLMDSYYVNMLYGIFDFSEFRMSFNNLFRLVREYLSISYRVLGERYTRADQALEREIEQVAVKFKARIDYIISTSEDYKNDEHLDERISSASRYFLDKLHPFVDLIKTTPCESDNKVARKRLKAAVDECYDKLYEICHVLKAFASEKFTLQKVLSVRAQVKQSLEKQTLNKKAASKDQKVIVPADAQNPQLYKALVEWRSAKGAKYHKPLYTILSNRTLLEISNIRPQSSIDLLAIPGIGVFKVKQYGTEILEIVKSH